MSTLADQLKGIALITAFVGGGSWGSIKSVDYISQIRARNQIASIYQDLEQQAEERMARLEYQRKIEENIPKYTVSECHGSVCY